MKVFERFGVPQPAWFKIEVSSELIGNPNEEGNDYLRKNTEFNKVPQHVCMAIIDDESEDKYIKLPPRLYQIFHKFEHVWIQPVYASLNTLVPSSLQTTLQPNLPLHFPLSIGSENGIQLLKSVTLMAIYDIQNQTAEAIKEYLHENP